MVKPFVRRPVAYMLFVGLLLMAFALSACGGASPTVVNVNETKGTTGSDVYVCDPTSITINKGDTVTFKNNSDEDQDFDKGDASNAGVDFVIAKISGSKDVTFNKSGTFTITSEKGATIKVIVN